jgi:hypothetical protein
MVQLLPVVSASVLARQEAARSSATVPLDHHWVLGIGIAIGLAFFLALLSSIGGENIGFAFTGMVLTFGLAVLLAILTDSGYAAWGGFLLGFVGSAALGFMAFCVSCWFFAQ